MQNFVKHGDNVTVTFPYASAAGGAVLVGAALFGVAQTATAQDAPGALLTTGVYSLPKAAVAIVPGDKLYWDNAAKVLTKTAAGNVYVAVATRAAIAGDGTVYARLNGVVA
jgi:predicted RecA/RadA family phage recombinase